jgi:ABC-type amino acid transport system permease subunit
MIELFFIVYRLPQIMSQLARERNRSRVGWSFAAIAAWIGTEFLVIFVYSFIYEVGVERWGWPERQPGGVLFLVYALALIAAMVGADIVRRVLHSIPVSQPHPPPPPQF